MLRWQWLFFVELFVLKQFNPLTVNSIEIVISIKHLVFPVGSMVSDPWTLPVKSSYLHPASMRILSYDWYRFHYDDVLMDAMASQITSLAIVYSTIDSDADQRKHQSSASPAFVRGIYRGPVNSPHKWSVTRKMFQFHDVIMRRFVGTHIGSGISRAYQMLVSLSSYRFSVLYF